MITNKYRTHSCGELNEENIGDIVKVSGWVSKIRDHGGVLFIDLRDEYGITQVVVHNENLLKGVSKETVVSISGEVTKRSEDTINDKISTGNVEVLATSLEILSKCESTLPFDIQNSIETREDLRLKYRFLDLRNTNVHENILFRSKVITHIRNKMQDLGFTEITTPILTSSSPEGARDYIIPSRKHKGKFYALPQAPQQFKQLLMASGFDRYFQIAPCFRDEDARADRSPGEFYQLDFEMAFATQEDIFTVGEEVLYDIFTKFSDKKVSSKPFPRIPFKEAMRKYGTDKPDLRNPLVIEDLTDFFTDVEFKPFKGQIVRGIVVQNCSIMPKSFFENMVSYAMSIGMKGLGYIDIEEDGLFKGPIAKFLSADKKNELSNRFSLKLHDTLFFISDKENIVDSLAGQIRTELANKMNLINNSTFEFCYITDFPMYEIDKETGKIDFTHNPFSMPQGELDALLYKDPLDIYAYQYDIVCNGVELSSGAVRNHKPEIMVKAFEIAGYTEETVKTKFGALYNAFKYGVPPHAGMAPGIDRILMLLKDCDTIKDVIAFPMNSNSEDILLGAPSEVTEKQLKEVHIKIR